MARATVPGPRRSIVEPVPMKLYTTLTSPYGRIARIVLIEKGLDKDVPIEVPATRQPDSPYYAINPSGRVPYLALDDGTGIEESAVICELLDRVGHGHSIMSAPGEAGFEIRRTEALARSMLDGLGVWGREHSYRDPAIHSATILAHEAARAARMVDLFEGIVDGDILTGPLNMAQITLAATLHGRDGRPPGFDWRTGRPRLSHWVDQMGKRESVASTQPPAG
jgi:glutathione S-transferase